MLRVDKILDFCPWTEGFLTPNDIVNSDNFKLVTYIDMTKAFDTVKLSILIKKKLDAVKIKGTTFSWCKPYHSNRAQGTMANGNYSGLNRIDCGVPQLRLNTQAYFFLYYMY